MSCEAGKIAHLGFIQAVINRMGNNSFLIKGWSVALIAAVFALSSQSIENMACLSYFAFILVMLFWFLDAYFLYQENLYRTLYKKVADGTVTSEFFIMDAKECKTEDDCYYKVFFSKTLLFYYGVIAVLIFLFILKIHYIFSFI